MSHASIIIPSYNSGNTIEKCLKAIRQSAYKDYELIVVDCKSQDTTFSIAKKYADKVIELNKNKGRGSARTMGIEASAGQIIINIDSDVVIKPDTLTKINDYFSKHQEVDALTGLLSKEHPNSNFFSQYKNLYMHYIFSILPEKATFLYGSIYALRREATRHQNLDIEIADDTALGQRLVSGGKQIGFLKDLEVIHLKKYNIFSFIRNDFQIPFDWAKIFLKYKGWKQLGRHKTGYAHSPMEQLISIILAPSIFLLFLLKLLGYDFIPLILFLILIWFFLNSRFFNFLIKEKGLIFGIPAIFVTFVDNIIMAIGILSGAVSFLVN